MTSTKPSKEQVRQFMQQRLVEHKPPPSPQEIREQLGWAMLWDRSK
jgi:hypothetical protein